MSIFKEWIDPRETRHKAKVALQTKPRLSGHKRKDIADFMNWWWTDYRKGRVALHYGKSMGDLLFEPQIEYKRWGHPVITATQLDVATRYKWPVYTVPKSTRETRHRNKKIEAERFVALTPTFPQFIMY